MKKLTEHLAARKARHRKRHSPTGATFALADRIDYLNGEHWDALTRGASIFLQRHFARALCRSDARRSRRRPSSARRHSR